MPIRYICSRIYLHDPPGDDNDLASAPLAPEALKKHVEHLRKHDPEVNQFVCMGIIAVAVSLTAVTAEWVRHLSCVASIHAYCDTSLTLLQMVESIEFVREKGNITEEWVGMILLPLVSFAADGAVGSVYFVRRMLHHFFEAPIAPTTLAKGEAIDLSIQFTLFWMPLFVLVAWWTNKPLTLLFG